MVVVSGSTGRTNFTIKKAKKLMYIDEKDFKIELGKAECNGVQRARNILIYVHQFKAKHEQDLQKKLWHEEEAKRLADDELWNLLVVEEGIK